MRFLLPERVETVIAVVAQGAVCCDYYFHSLFVDAAACG